MNGIIIDGSTGQPLVAVNIFESTQTGQPISTVGTTTDQNGRFVADSLKSEFIGFRYVGFQPLVIPNRPGFVKIEMAPAVNELPPVVVKPKQTNRAWLWVVGLLAAYKLTR